MVSFTHLLPLIFSLTSAQTTPIRYMPFGDSITEIVCWRAKLWDKLQTTNFSSVNFVGSGKNENQSGCKNSKYDRDNEGHSGFLAIDIANKNQLDGWLKQNPADLITMHLGTNDIVQQNKNVADIIAAFTKLVTTMRTSNPKMKIIVAQIIPITIGSYNSKIQQLNTAIVPWAQGLNKTESPIWVVDQYTGFGSSDLRDGIHPSDAGDVKMTNVWFPAIMSALQAVKADRGGKEVGVEFVA